MIKKGLFLIVLTMVSNVQAKNILLTYFDPFDGKSANNSEVMANLVAQELKDSELKVTLCELSTIFDKAYEQLHVCVHSADAPIDMVISLGEAGCRKLKIETRAKNLDRSYGPDNDGVERYKEEILPGQVQQLGVTLPVDQAYCAFNPDEQKNFFISQDAGSFVCNNTLYLGLTHLEVPYTFIHVPEAKCTTESRNHKLAPLLTKFIRNLSLNIGDTLKVQPAKKSEVKILLNSGTLNSCQKKFYRILKSEY